MIATRKNDLIERVGRGLVCAGVLLFSTCALAYCSANPALAHNEQGSFLLDEGNDCYPWAIAYADGTYDAFGTQSAMNAVLLTTSETVDWSGHAPSLSQSHWLGIFYGLAPRLTNRIVCAGSEGFE